ncbi:hypothetical protein KCP78_15510 [Salmonella enterica subsp. enterica]|nr:hypothetical protein KCP78_15510 [Salmonella enterica subsp. enterica]
MSWKTDLPAKGRTYRLLRTVKTIESRGRPVWRSGMIVQMFPSAAKIRRLLHLIGSWLINDQPAGNWYP